MTASEKETSVVTGAQGEMHGALEEPRQGSLLRKSVSVSVTARVLAAGIPGGDLERNQLQGFHAVSLFSPVESRRAAYTLKVPCVVAGR